MHSLSPIYFPTTCILYHLYFNIFMSTLKKASWVYSISFFKKTTCVKWLVELFQGKTQKFDLELFVSTCFKFPYCRNKSISFWPKTHMYSLSWPLLAACLVQWPCNHYLPTHSCTSSLSKSDQTQRVEANAPASRVH